MGSVLRLVLLQCLVEICWLVFMKSSRQTNKISRCFGPDTLMSTLRWNYMDHCWQSKTHWGFWSIIISNVNIKTLASSHHTTRSSTTPCSDSLWSNQCVYFHLCPFVSELLVGRRVGVTQVFLWLINRLSRLISNELPGLYQNSRCCVSVLRCRRSARSDVCWGLNVVM